MARADGLLFGTGSAFRFADQMFASLGADLQPAVVDPHGEVHRSNRFLSALRALDDSSRRQPVMLLLDDLHWSDADSLALVEFVCSQITSRSVAVVATLRPWPPDAIESVRRLERDGCAIITELGPLSRDASRALMASRAWGDIAPSTIEQASSVCGGNPLLIEEVARSLVGGSAIPALEPFSTGRRAILLRRFAGVSDDTYRFLRAASVLGSAFRSVCGGEDGRLRSSRCRQRARRSKLRRVSSRRGLVSAQFVHPLFSGALYEGLQGPLRTELHEAAFRALRFLGGGLGEAADQAMMAELTDDVAVSSVRAAGEEALRVGGLVDRRQIPPPRGEDRRAEGNSRDAARTRGGACSFGVSRRGGRDARSADRAARRRAGRARTGARGPRRSPPRVRARWKHRWTASTRRRRSSSRSTGPLLSTLYLRGAFVATAHLGSARDDEPGRTSNGAVARRLQGDAAADRRGVGIGAVMLSRPDGFEVLSRSVETIEAEPELLEEFSDSGWWPILWCMVAATITERFDAAQHAYDVGFSAAERMGWPAAMAAYLVGEVSLMLRLGNIDKAEADLGKAREHRTARSHRRALLDPRANGYRPRARISAGGRKGLPGDGVDPRAVRCSGSRAVDLVDARKARDCARAARSSMRDLRKGGTDSRGVGDHRALRHTVVGTCVGRLPRSRKVRRPGEDCRMARSRHGRHAVPMAEGVRAGG